MGKHKAPIKHYQPQKPVPRQSWWQRIWYQPEGYTAEEMHFRDKVMILRTHSGIDPTLLQTDEPWFQTELELALVIKNQDAFFFKTEYVPRTKISRDTFHIVLPKQHQAWPHIAVLRLKTSDFLLHRAKAHSDAELNEPMHFVYLDLIQIFSRLGENPNAEYVALQLPKVSQYLQQLSSLIPDPRSSDKLFIEDCRVALRHVLNNDISAVLNSQQFTSLLSQLQVHLELLGEHYHTLLHFALVDSKVNDHPYWEYFISREALPNQEAFPTMTGQDCLSSNTAITSSTSEATNQVQTLVPHCPSLQFLSSSSDAQRQLYFENLEHLQQLLRFKSMLSQVQSLAQKGGEIFTLHYFREDLLGLMDQVDLFFSSTHKSMLRLLNENDQLHHQSIVELSNVGWWQRLFPNTKNKLMRYISNQNNFARFGITQQSLQHQLDKVTNLLLRSNTQLRSHRLLEEEKILSLQQDAQILLTSLYQWRIEQNPRLGLPLPSLPKLLNQAQAAEPTTACSAPVQSITDHEGSTTSAINRHTSQRRLLSLSEVAEQAYEAPVSAHDLPSSSLRFFPISAAPTLGLHPAHTASMTSRHRVAPASGGAQSMALDGNSLLGLMLGLPGLLLLGYILYRYYSQAPHEEDVLEEDDAFEAHSDPEVSDSEYAEETLYHEEENGGLIDTTIR